MNRLYLRVALAVLGALLIGGAAFVALMFYIISETDRQARDSVLDARSQALIDQLEDTEPADWAYIVEEACRQGAEVRRIRPSHGRRPPRGRGVSLKGVSCRRGPPRLLRLPPGPILRVPIKDGAFEVEIPQAHPTALFFAPIVFVALLVVFSSGLVGWPLIRRMRRLDHAIGELGRGNLDVRLDGLTGALGDVAHRLNDSAASLQTMFAEREELLQAVSHELGTPISRIKFQLELARAQSDDPALHARLDAIHDDLEDMRRLSRELVGWLDAGRARLQYDTFEVGEVVATLTELATEFDARDLDIQFDFPEDPLILSAEPRLFQRAIENLLTNAVRYTHSRISVSVRRSDDSVEIVVEDNGPGIPATERRRVFEPFVRLETSRSRDHGGVGLGMAITRRIIKAHNASIAIDDSELGGARITTRWPLKSGDVG